MTLHALFPVIVRAESDVATSLTEAESPPKVPTQDDRRPHTGTCRPFCEI
jgi:hypothetical protein